MQIEFVNHSSFVVRSGDVSLISDPWLEGTAFDEGWALLSKTAMPYERFGEMTHLWFSHEHPDHFSPPCLKKIPEDARRKIQVLYQETLDKKVIDYCKKLGFGSTRELPHGKPVSLGPDFEFTCQPFVGFEDSWSLTRTKEARILNLNDCTVNTREQIEQVRAQVGEIDVLFTQFSISAWDGNALDLERRQNGARKMLQRAVLQAQILKPKYVVPFASFIWFCHEENAYMNEAFLPIEEVYGTLQRESGAEVLLLYPGDVWTYGERHDSARALARYQADIASLATRPRIRSRRVEEQELQETAQSFCARVKEGASPTKLRLHLARQIPRFRRRRSSRVGSAWKALLDALLLRYEPARIYVSDLGRSYTFDLTHGLRRAELAEDECDKTLGSEALWYGFKHLWGGQTLHINGRFRRTQSGGPGPLFHFFDLAAEQSAGRPVAWKRPREKTNLAKG